MEEKVFYDSRQTALIELLKKKRIKIQQKIKEKKTMPPLEIGNFLISVRDLLKPPPQKNQGTQKPMNLKAQLKSLLKRREELETNLRDMKKKVGSVSNDKEKTFKKKFKAFTNELKKVRARIKKIKIQRGLESSLALKMQDEKNFPKLTKTIEKYKKELKTFEVKHSGFVAKIKKIESAQKNPEKDMRKLYTNRETIFSKIINDTSYKKRKKALQEEQQNLFQSQKEKETLEKNLEKYIRLRKWLDDTRKKFKQYAHKG